MMPLPSSQVWDSPRPSGPAETECALSTGGKQSANQNFKAGIKGIEARKAWTWQPSLSNVCCLYFPQVGGTQLHGSPDPQGAGDSFSTLAPFLRPPGTCWWCYDFQLASATYSALTAGAAIPLKEQLQMHKAVFPGHPEACPRQV